MLERLHYKIFFHIIYHFNRVFMKKYFLIEYFQHNHCHSKVTSQLIWCQYLLLINARQLLNLLRIKLYIQKLIPQKFVTYDGYSLNGYWNLKEFDILFKILLPISHITPYLRQFFKIIICNKCVTLFCSYTLFMRDFIIWMSKSFVTFY